MQKLFNGHDGNVSSPDLQAPGSSRPGGAEDVGGLMWNPAERCTFSSAAAALEAVVRLEGCARDLKNEHERWGTRLVRFESAVGQFNDIKDGLWAARMTEGPAGVTTATARHERLEQTEGMYEVAARAAWLGEVLHMRLREALADTQIARGTTCMHKTFKGFVPARGTTCSRLERSRLERCVELEQEAWHELQFATIRLNRYMKRCTLAVEAAESTSATRHTLATPDAEGVTHLVRSTGYSTW